MPSTAGWNYVSSPTMITPNTTINPPVVNGVPRTGTPPKFHNYYLVTSFAKQRQPDGEPRQSLAGWPQENYLAISRDRRLSARTRVATRPSPCRRTFHLEVYFDGKFPDPKLRTLSTRAVMRGQPSVLCDQSSHPPQRRTGSECSANC